MKSVHIVLDANIIIREGFGSSGDFRLLLSNLDILEHNLYIPKLVLEEVTARFELAYDKRKQRVSGDMEWLSRHLGLELPAPIVSLDKRMKAGLFRNQLTEQFNIPNCNVIDYPDTLHEDLVKRATTRRKPFNQHGVGYRDSLIWETTLSLAARLDNQLVLLSENTADFGDDRRELHQDLVQDLADRELPIDKVILVSSLDAFITTYIRPSLPEGTLE